MTKEQRIAQIIKMSMKELVAHALELGLKNVQYKKLDRENPANNKLRPIQNIAELIYEKEN